MGASDAVRVICPNLKCRSVLTVPGSARGKVVRCSQCGSRVRIPMPPVPADRPTAIPEDETSTV